MKITITELKEIIREELNRKRKTLSESNIDSLILTDEQLKNLSLFQLENELEGVTIFFHGPDLSSNDRIIISAYLDKIKNEINSKTRHASGKITPALSDTNKSVEKYYPFPKRAKERPKYTVESVKEIIREEILAEKLKKRKKKFRKLAKDFYPMHPYPYHLPPGELSGEKEHGYPYNLSPEEYLQRHVSDEDEDDYGELGYPDIEIA